DYSRFSWVFFLASKDETPSILKTFIISLENILSLKVKIIRCDNGTEFKNSDLNLFCGVKGIKREFSVPRTPQQSGIVERKNRTLIEAARTLLANSLLPIPFWAEAVNTACYVQNRVLVTKPHNKTPYELLHGRLPSIGFMRPFGCPVTILNTLDPLGKFQGKVNEVFLIGYSVCSKAFRVLNSRTRIVQETLHVNFIENKPNVAGFGPAWLFDIVSLSQTMNYHPVIAENQSNTHAGFQDTEKAEEEGTQSYVLYHVLSDGFRDLSAKFEEYYNNSSNGVNAASSSVSIAGQNSIDSTNDFSAAGPSIAAMPILEDLSYDADDVGAEADINNLESIISVSPILTTKIHKDHPTSQIIGDLSSTTQTRSMASAVRDQGRISQIFSWVFFLASKDETPSVLKTFIIGLENLLSFKVKIIRYDNGTEFKNSDLNQFCGVKGIKREFSVPRTPQQNGIAKRKNRTLIEAAKTLLADSLLLIPFSAEAVNTACYVQNRVLVTKPHNKTPYELLHGKFQGKVDEGFLIGYSVCSKTFRVFNSRTRIVQETLHVNFMENKPNVVGFGPTWLFDIDSLSQTMNYHPVIAENQSNTHAGFQDTEKAGEEGTQTYVLFPVLYDGFTNSQNNNKDVHADGKEHDDDIQKDLNVEFEEYYNNSSNGVNAASSSVSTAGQNSIDRTNDFSAAGPSNVAMPNLEDLSHNADDVGAEA
nr:hypothetical protein [Tanacetum cinerariifolium]